MGVVTTVNPRKAGKVREHAKPGQSEKTAWRRQVSGPRRWEDRLWQGENSNGSFLGGGKAEARRALCSFFMVGQQPLSDGVARSHKDLGHCHSLSVT